MDFSHLKHLALSVAVLTVVGCASAPKSSQVVNRPALELASVVGNASPGDTIELAANNSLGMDTVVVDRTYFAASGRECRRMRDVNGNPIARVACKGRDGQWRFARDLRPVSSLQRPANSVLTSTADASSVVAQPLIPSAGSTRFLNQDGSLTDRTLLNDSDESVIISEVVDEAAAIDIAQIDIMSESADVVKRELLANETLWKFAKRTTGNALNWKTIADVNNITDAKTLAPGAQLRIPVALVSEGG